MRHTTKFRRLALALALLSSLNYLLTFIPNTTLSPVTQAYSFGPPEADGTVYALTVSNRLVSFNQATPGALQSNVAISGLAQGENLLGMDFRPRTGQLFALSTNNRVYTLNPQTGAATPVGTAPISPVLNSSILGFDFNPVPDRIRVVTEGEQNLRLNPDTGAVAATDTDVAFAPGDPNANANPSIAGAAYTNNFAGATSTTLYVIDHNLNALVRQGSVGGAPDSPNGGRLFTIGALGVNTTEQVGFDISAPGDVALASLTLVNATTSALYNVNLITGAATAIGAIGVNEVVRDIAVTTRLEVIYAVSASNRLLSFNSGTPGTLAAARVINGLQPGEQVLGLDFRPATGQLYALTNAGRLYTLDPNNAAATPVSGLPINPALAGNSFGFDFNPQPDRIRVVSDARQNLRLNPNNGTVAGTDTTLAYATGDPNANATPSIVGAAYTNSFAGTPATTLYVIDANLDALVLQGSINGTPNSPNGGQLTTVGALGVNTTEQVGFDIAPQTNAAFASLTVGSASNLYTVNLANGATTLVGAIAGGEIIRDIAIANRIDTVFAVTAGNNLVSFASTAPGTLNTTTPIIGLPQGEQITGIDFRPATGQLFGLGCSSRVYTINTGNGVAAPVGTTPFTPALNGTAFGMDFNPVPDRIRVTSNTRQNLRLNPDTGAVAATDSQLAFAAGDPNANATPNIVGVAYTNNFAGVTSTTLFVIDSNLDALVRQGSPGGAPTSPNSGQLFTIGALGVNTNEQVGFDIGDCSGIAYASLNVAGATATQFVSVNLITGATSTIGTIGGTESVRAIAVANNFIPAATQAGLAVVNAASFSGDALAPEAIAAAFGNFNTTNNQSAGATSVPLPRTLAGVRVSVNGTDAGLFFVSPFQINFTVPLNVPDGLAVVTVTNANGTTRAATVNILRAAPGLFSARGTGQGTAAAVATMDGVNYQSVLNPDGSERELAPGTRERPNYLILFATGLRNAAGAQPTDANGVAEAVTVTFRGVPAVVTYAGVAGEGVDQINAQIPPELAGAGSVPIRAIVNGQVSNTVTARIGGQPPQVRTQPIAYGQTVAGALTSDDQVMRGPGGTSYFLDAYRFSANAGTTIAADLRSQSFDAAVVLYRRNTDGSLTPLAADDQLGGLGDGEPENDNALLLTVLPETADYVLVATSAERDAQATGGYTLRLLGNALQAVSYGATVNGSISTTDLQTSAGDYLDAYWFAGTAGDQVQIRMASSTFDSLLILGQNNGELLAADDNSGGGQDALLTRVLPATGVYVILATPFAPNRTGNYTLTLNRGAVTATAEPLAMLPSRAPRERNADTESLARFEQMAARVFVSNPSQP